MSKTGRFLLFFQDAKYTYCKGYMAVNNIFTSGAHWFTPRRFVLIQNQRGRGGFPEIMTSAHLADKASAAPPIG